MPLSLSLFIADTAAMLMSRHIFWCWCFSFSFHAFVFTLIMLPHSCWYWCFSFRWFYALPFSFAIILIVSLFFHFAFRWLDTPSSWCFFHLYFRWCCHRCHTLSIFAAIIYAIDLLFRWYFHATLALIFFFLLYFSRFASMPLLIFSPWLPWCCCHYYWLLLMIIYAMLIISPPCRHYFLSDYDISIFYWFCHWYYLPLFSFSIFDYYLHFIIYL